MTRIIQYHLYQDNSSYALIYEICPKISAIRRKRNTLNDDYVSFKLLFFGSHNLLSALFPLSKTILKLSFWNIQQLSHRILFYFIMSFTFFTLSNFFPFKGFFNFGNSETRNHCIRTVRRLTDLGHGVSAFDTNQTVSFLQHLIIFSELVGSTPCLPSDLVKRIHVVNNTFMVEKNQ